MWHKVKSDFWLKNKKEVKVKSGPQWLFEQTRVSLHSWDLYLMWEHAVQLVFG